MPFFLRFPFRLVWVASAALAFGSNLHAADEPIVMGPFTVDETSLARRLHYCEVAGFEVLSVFSAEKTAAIAEALQRQRALLSLIIPPEFQPKAGALPQAIFFDEQEPARAAERIAAMQRGMEGRQRATAESSLLRTPMGEDAKREMQGTLRQINARQEWLEGPAWPLEREVALQSLAAVRGDAGPLSGRPRPIPHALFVRLACAELPERALYYVNVFGIDMKTVTPGFAQETQPSLRQIFPVRALVTPRAPRLPRWAEQALASPVSAVMRRAFGEAEMAITPMLLMTTPIAGLTVEQAFAENHRPEETATRAGFVRMFLTWALLDENPTRAHAFWKFVERSTGEPATTAMFTECFGRDGWKELHAFWEKHSARRRSSGGDDGLVNVSFRAAAPPTLTRPVIRRATRAESVRLRSEYEWRLGRELEAADPVLARQCIEIAGRRMRHAYTEGERDPAFLAVLALFECDAGDETIARQRVEEAAATGVLRPQVYVELARFRTDEARAQLAAPGGKFTAAQAEGIFAVLKTARAQSPALGFAQHLLADTWARNPVPPAERDLAELAQSVTLFPRDPVLAFKVATLHAQAGATSEAARIARQGLRWTEAESDVGGRLGKLAALAR